MVHIFFNNNLYVIFLKQGMYVFHFMFNILYLISEILLYFLKIIYDEMLSGFPLLSVVNDRSWKDPWQKRWQLAPWWSFYSVFILWNSKKYVVTCLGENKKKFSFCNLVTIIAKQFIYFATLVVTHWFKYAFLCFLSSYEVKTFPIYIRVETFVRG